MKLLKKISIYFIISSAFVIITGSVTTYFVIQALINEEVQETLELEKKDLLEHIQITGLNQERLKFGNVDIVQIPDSITLPEQYSDTLIYIAEENEAVPFMQLELNARISGKNYRIHLRRSLIEKDDVALGITVMMTILFILMILLLNVINFWSGRRLWNPFYQTLNKLTRFKLTNREDFHLADENIDEFHQLNNTLNILAAKLQEDYRTLKEFSENAAHEMQTPLAVMRSKLDVLIQDKSLTAEQMQTIQSLLHSVSRLARLNQSLNLLTKIENLEFNEIEEIDFSTLIEQQIVNLNELIQMNELKVEMHLDIHFIKRINPFMAETLLTNLLINAVKHNISGGFIEIETTADSLIISNSGPPLQSKPQDLFSRFKKDHPSPDSPGLGLSIVQSICEHNGLKAEYWYNEEKHTITIHNQNLEIR